MAYILETVNGIISLLILIHIYVIIHRHRVRLGLFSRVALLGCSSALVCTLIGRHYMALTIGSLFTPIFEPFVSWSLIITLIFMVIVDKQAKTEMLLTDLFENSQLALLICDRRGKIININQSFLNLLGSKSRQNTLNINILKFPLLVNQGISERVRNVINSGKGMIFCTTYTSAWGKTTSVTVYITPIQSCRYIEIGVIDESEKIKALQEKERVGNLLQKVIDSVDSLIFVRDKAYKFLLVNKAFANAYGYNDPVNLIGKKDSDVVPDYAKQGNIEAEDDFVRSENAPLIIRERMIKINGCEHWFKISKSPMPDGNIVGVATDITELKIMHNRMKDLVNGYSVYMENSNRARN